MSVSESHSSGPVIAMPKKTPAGLRSAVARLEPEALEAFDAHWASSMDQARNEYSLVPVRHFIEHWWTWVAVIRWPERAQRMRQCQRIVADSEDRAERRAAAGEIGLILDDAVADADGGQ
ncbi:DUF6247 family protein [Nocardiopsis coralliicola]